MSDYATKWVADAGVKWQPTTLNGSRRWTRRTGLVGRTEFISTWSIETDVHFWEYPDLYNSRRRAERIGRREQKRRDRKAANTYREADQDG